MCLCDVAGDGTNLLLVGADDYGLRLYTENAQVNIHLGEGLKSTLSTQPSLSPIYIHNAYNYSTRLSQYTIVIAEKLLIVTTV